MVIYIFCRITLLSIVMIFTEILDFESENQKLLYKIISTLLFKIYAILRLFLANMRTTT